MIDLRLGDCREVLKTLPDNSVDSIVTDPPYELGFMGKSWDSTGIAYDPIVWTQCLRVLKPGGHLLSFGGTRTYHRMVCAIEDAGFEIRDEVLWIYGSGFPKSMSVGKAIDKKLDEQSEVVGVARSGSSSRAYQSEEQTTAGVYNRTIPSTPEGKVWQGWGTALKPAHEPICLARKPIEGTVANNVLKWGVGGINVDGCRVGTAADMNSNDFDDTRRTAPKFSGTFNGGKEGQYRERTGQVPAGRFPANLITDGSEEVVKMFPDSVTKRNENPSTCDEAANTWGGTFQRDRGARGYDGSGSACRFFYSAKASGEDRNEGLEGRNPHPTIKPVDLMCYLCRLITPKGGTVLDPFMGSGSTGKAAQMEGFNFIGIELDSEYMKIAKARIGYADNLFTPS